MKKYVVYIFAGLIVSAFLFYGCSVNENIIETDSVKVMSQVNIDNASATNRIVAHAMGQINGDKRTNSLEAFKNSYSAGTRVFEVDFFNTADHRIVAVHDWEEWFGWIGEDIDNQIYRSYSHTDFMATKIAYKYTPLDLETIAALMIEYPDIFIITDTKRPAEKQYKDDISRIYIALEMAQEGLSERLIVQAYNERNIKIAQQLLPDSNIIFTAYMSGLQNKDIAALCSEYPDLYGITVEKSKITDEIIHAANKEGLKTYVHTVNSDEDYTSYFSSGVYGVYTDDLTVADIEN